MSEPMGVATARLAMRLMRRRPDLFEMPGDGGDPRVERRRAAALARPLPERRYAILFMPRSSSTRLTRIAESAGLGKPGEFANPNHLRRMARALGSKSMEGHWDAVIRHSARGGLFGVEATPLHVRSVFGELPAMRDALGIERWGWLVRRDIVAQAVSSVRMVRTGQAHDDGSGAATEGSVPYDGPAIRWAFVRMAAFERLGERMMRRAGISPLRLDYEGLTAMSEAEVAAGLARWLGRPAPPPPSGAQHRKLAGAEAAEQAARFRAENPRLVRAIEAMRASTIRALPARPFEDA